MKVLIVDDHALFREGLSYVLNKLESDVVILEASHSQEALDILMVNQDINLVLLDLFMPGKNGFSLLESASLKFAMIPIIVLSASKEKTDMQRAIATGAMGYIPKDSTSKIMLSAINLVLSGGVYMPLDMLPNQKINYVDVKKTVILTPRQKQVMAMVARGLSNKVIALELGVKESTIKMHITSIMKSLGVSNRTQAVIEVQKLEISLKTV